MTPCDANGGGSRAVVVKSALTPESNGVFFPDTIEVLCGLAMNWPGRTGVVNVRVCLKDEQMYRHDVPACVALETVKLRYMAESYVNRYFRLENPLLI